jgi:hypothetical protein
VAVTEDKIRYCDRGGIKQDKITGIQNRASSYFAFREKKALIILPSEKNSHQIERNRGLNFKPRLLDLF